MGTPEIELEPEHRNNQRSEHVHQFVEPSIFDTLLPCEGVILLTPSLSGCYFCIMAEVHAASFYYLRWFSVRDERFVRYCCPAVPQAFQENGGLIQKSAVLSSRHWAWHAPRLVKMLISLLAPDIELL